MIEQLTSFIEKLPPLDEIRSYDEAATCNSLILPLLQKIGWDIFKREEVFPQFPVQGKRVNYALRISNKEPKERVFIEAKKPFEELDIHEQQLLMYTAQHRVALACLTNGIEWRLYLPLREGKWQDSRFFTIHLKDQVVTDIVSSFFEYLGRDSIDSGKSMINAGKILDERKINDKLKSAIPKSWEELLSEPDELLVDLLLEKTTKVSGGYTPKKEQVAEFIVGQLKTHIDIPAINQRNNINIPQNSQNKPQKIGLLDSKQRPKINISQEQIIPTILKILERSGGEASYDDICKNVYIELNHVFHNDPYWHEMTGTNPRWKHFTAWSLQRARHTSQITNSRRGYWKLVHR